MKRVAKKHWKTLAEIDNGLIFKSLAQLILNKKIQKDGIKSGELIEDVIRDIMNEKGITGFENLPINLSICTVDTLTTDECIFTTKEENLENEHIHYITGALRLKLLFVQVCRSLQFTQPVLMTSTTLLTAVQRTICP